MAKRKTLRERAGAYSRKLKPDAMTEEELTGRACAVSGYEAGYRAGARSTRISAAQRRVVKVALAAAKHCRKYGTVPLDELMAEVAKLERAKGDRK